MQPAIFSWSSGKDSALALFYCLQQKKLDVQALFTTVNSQFERVSMHGTREELLEAQARALGFPLRKIFLPESPSMEEYAKLMEEFLKERKKEGVQSVVFGDIFLEDLKKYRVENLREIDMSAHFPLWKTDTRELLLDFISKGFKTIVVCVNGNKLDKSFVGRVIDEQFLADLPEDVDPCGENGEFHTFAFDGPIFKHPVSFETGEIISRTYRAENSSDSNTEYHFLDLKHIN
ncbi:MAG: diphthine--ammonia ligase [Cytophagales bacterium]|nr:diphthine--ammonia ligase [Cytophagales bacterium]